MCDTKSNTFYLIASRYLIFMVKLPISNQWKIVLSDTVTQEELYRINAALASHEDFEYSHPNFYFSVVCVVCVGIFGLAGNFLGFSEADDERFWRRSIWSQRWAFMSLTISVEVVIVTSISLSGINIWYKTK